MPRPHSTMEYTLARRRFIATLTMPYYCYYCGRQVERSTEAKSAMFTVDHHQPLSAGGALDDEKNFRVACSSCNQKRGKMFDLASRGRLRWDFLGEVFNRIRRGKLHPDFLAYLRDERVKNL